MKRSALSRHDGSTDAWWQTSISRVEPNVIEIRGYPIEQLIGRLSYSEMLALLILGRRLAPGEVELLDAALVAGADHGPRAPSIAAARMAATCGVSFNSAVATGINMLGDHHGGAVEQFMERMQELREASAANDPKRPAELAHALVSRYRAQKSAVPGYGHQLHDRDPRRQRILQVVDGAVEDGVIEGAYAHLALEVEAQLERVVGKAVPLNVDGLSGIVYLELGFPAAVAKGLFSLSRGAGIVAHALEEHQQGAVIKGPCPPGDELVRYVGPETRSLLAPLSSPEHASRLEDEFWSTLGEEGVCVYWGTALDEFNKLDSPTRQMLVAYTITASQAAEPDRARTLREITDLPVPSRLAALCERARGGPTAP